MDFLVGVDAVVAEDFVEAAVADGVEGEEEVSGDVDDLGGLIAPDSGGGGGSGDLVPGEDVVGDDVVGFTEGVGATDRRVGRNRGRHLRSGPFARGRGHRRR